MPGIFSGRRHIPGIFARIHVFLRVMKHDSVKNHENLAVLWGISYTAGVCCLPCETQFATIEYFSKNSGIFRGNYFFQSLAPLSVHVGSHPPGRETFFLDSLIRQ